VRDELVNALDQMLENFHLDNQSENQSENQSKISQNDQSDKIQLRQLDRKRRASKLAERMIQYDLRKKMPRANVIRNKFAYKKIAKCLTHMTRMLATLITDQQSDEPQILKNVMQRSD
jgi:hypothetical protein